MLAGWLDRSRRCGDDVDTQPAARPPARPPARLQAEGARRRRKESRRTRAVSHARNTHQAAEAEGCRLLWRKAVAKGAAEAHTIARPAYSHLLCFAKGPVG